MPMPLIPNIAVFQRKLAGFPIAAYQAGETVLTAASRTGRLLILRKGALAVLREGVEIATVREPVPCSASSPCFSISRTRRMYVRWKPRNFMSPMRPP
jgi:hypothetical protein